MIYLHKFLPLITSPLFLVLVIILIGIFLKSKQISLLGLLVLIFCSLPIISNKLISYLEKDYLLTPTSSAKPADAIVVLSGMVRTIKGKNGLVYEWGEASDRIFAGIDLLKKNKAPLAYKKWIIPVCFDNDYCTDLVTYFADDYKKVASYINAFLKEELIVHHFGFLPGFCYLSGLKKELQLPRKQNPILKVPKGSVAVGGTYAGIYPQQSPGGWHLIGRTNVAMFRPEKDVPTFANPGDSFMFKAISKATYLSVFNTAADSQHPKYTTSYAQP